jgi:hypothetical protein
MAIHHMKSVKSIVRVMSKTFAALAAVLALGAVAVASASAALPEFVPAEGGKLPITLEGSFPSASGGVTSTSNKSVGCAGIYAKGEITGAKTASLVIELRHCEDGEGYQCELGEKGAGIEYFSGSASLVYLNKAKKEVGLVLTQKRIKGDCFTESAWIQGGLIIPITPVNTKTSKPTFTLNDNGKGVQEFQSYENEKGEVVKAHLELNLGSGPIMAALSTGALSLTANKSLTVSG